MSGIVFFGTKQSEALRDFYVGKVGMDVWLEQEDCTIYKHGNLLLGFCLRESLDSCGIITFYFDTKDEVDTMYDTFRQEADEEPRINEKYRIYHFFVRDPEGRLVEFQQFIESPIGVIYDGRV